MEPRVSPDSLPEGPHEEGSKVAGYLPLPGKAFREEDPSASMAKELRTPLARADAWITHDDRPPWRPLTVENFLGRRRNVVVDGRGILRREAMKGVELLVLGG